MQFKISCTCGKHLTVSSANVGKRGRCPTCKAEFIVPDPSGRAPQSAPASRSMARPAASPSVPSFADQLNNLPVGNPTATYPTNTSGYAYSQPSKGLSGLAIAAIAAAVCFMIAVPVTIFAVMKFTKTQSDEVAIASEENMMEWSPEKLDRARTARMSRDMNQYRIKLISMGLADTSDGNSNASGANGSSSTASDSPYGSGYDAKTSTTGTTPSDDEQYAQSMSPYGSNYRDAEQTPAHNPNEGYDGGYTYETPEWKGFEDSGYTASQTDNTTPPAYSGNGGYNGGYNGGSGTAETPPAYGPAYGGYGR